MNERYLFKGKNSAGEWVIGSLVDDFISGDRYINSRDYSSKIDPVTICQCTGLRDKNETQIFEGDVFKTSLGHIAIVEWDGDNARFLGFTADGKRNIIYVGREPKVEVIGNIHDNPDLLKAIVIDPASGEPGGAE